MGWNTSLLRLLRIVIGWFTLSIQETNQWATGCSLSLRDGPWQKNNKKSGGPFSVSAHWENARYARLPIQPCTGQYKRKEIQRAMEGGVAVHQDQIRKQQVVTMMWSLCVCVCVCVFVRGGNHLETHPADIKRRGGRLNQWTFTVLIREQQADIPLAFRLVHTAKSYGYVSSIIKLVCWETHMAMFTRIVVKR